MTLARRTLLALLFAGALVRIIVLPLPGTVDVEALKLWSYGANHDFSGVYGVGGSPLERREVHWLDLSGVVTYPPMSIVEVAIAGRVYRAILPDYPNSTLLTLLIKLTGFLSEVLFVAVLLTWGRRVMGQEAAEWSAIAFWLSPGIWFTGCALGYSDAQAAVPIVLALIAALGNWPVVVGALAAVSVLTKPQAVFLVPVLAVLILRRTTAPDWRGLLRAAMSGASTTLLIVLPFIIRGSFPNLLQAMSRLFKHDMLSAQSANLGWIGTWLLRVRYAIPDVGWHEALTMKIRILALTRVQELGFPNARVVGVMLTSAALAWAMWRTWRGVSRAGAAALASWSLYAYVILGAQVHENHLYMALPMLVFAAGELPELRAPFWAVSAIVTLNIYLFEGLGSGHPPLIDRGWTFVDMTVLLSVVNVGVFVWLTRRIAAATRVPQRIAMTATSA
jgi:hypothetical protein